MDGKSLDINELKISQLREIFPEVFSENKIDFQRLKQSLGEDIFVKDEHYELTWAGKSEARKEIQKQTTATLIPDRENSIDFDNAQNIFIEGENLEVLRVLQKSYFGKVKMIYIDPPYNTGNDSFVYPDDYSERQDEYNKRTGITDDEGFLNKQDLWKKNTKENGQFHSVWLSMMYPRLYLSRNLLKEDGVIFISIDENEVANLKLLLNEVFGEENFVSQIVWQRHAGGGNDSKYFATDHEYIFCISKNINNIQKLRLPLDNDDLSDYTKKDKHFERLGLYKTKSFYRLRPDDPRPGLQYNIECPDGSILFGEWKWEQNSFLKAKDEDKVIIRQDKKGRWLVEYKIYQKDEDSEEKQKVPRTLILDSKTRNSFGKSVLTDILGVANIFNNPKPIELLKHLIKIGTEPNENHIILDFFAGSGSTAHAVLDLNKEDGGNRKFICIQLAEKCDEESTAIKEGYKFISEITLKRITNIIKSFNGESRAEINFANRSDLGLKSFYLSNSNFKNWISTIDGKENIYEQLVLFKDSNNTSDSTKLIYELILKIGFPLDCTIELQKFKDINFWIINKTHFILLENINLDFCKYILDLKPKAVICLDKIFENNDKFKTNFSLMLKESYISFKTV